MEETIDARLLRLFMGRASRPRPLSLDYIKKRVIETAGDNPSKEALDRTIDRIELEDAAHFTSGNDGKPAARLSAVEMLEGANRKAGSKFQMKQPAPATIELSEKERKQIESMNADELLTLANKKNSEASR